MMMMQLFHIVKNNDKINKIVQLDSYVTFS